MLQEPSHFSSESEGNILCYNELILGFIVFGVVVLHEFLKLLHEFHVVFSWLINRLYLVNESF